MDAGEIRVQIIQFSLLIVITIAGISVAVRHDDGHHRATQASRSGTSSVSASPQGSSGVTSGGSSGAGGSSGSRRQGNGSSGTATQGTGNQGTGTGGTIGPSGGGTTTTAPSLPRTGTQITELAGLAALMIAGGSFSVTVSRRSPR